MGIVSRLASCQMARAAGDYLIFPAWPCHALPRLALPYPLGFSIRTEHGSDMSKNERRASFGVDLTLRARTSKGSSRPLFLLVGFLQEA